MDSWVQEFIPKGARVGGIFLHDISTKRRSARSRGPLILEKWSGQDKVQLHPGAIRVATTNWNASASDPGADARHTELENTEWKRFTVHKFKGSATDAWRIVDDLIDTLLGLPLPPIIDKFAGDIILLIGQTGSGRSNFAKVADESCTAVVNDKQTSTSMEINYYTVSCSRPSRSVVLVEAPGFDHLEKSDAETLACIAKWLKTFCTRDTTLAGIIYFHDITKDRLGASYGQVWLDHLSPETARHLLLVSTKWDRGGSSTREEELKSGAWKSAICRGAKVRRFENTNEAAWRIIDDLLGVQPRLDLHKVTRGLSGVQNKGEADAKMRH
ncbi:hypothetical protein NLJ89_g6343 [Agrocybe chaxingu]|uniref:G domain-containing protein n=1 Tax=Agrocybe chaxingu TaxID=84603 RepID=A0A9W8K5R2_9AGAR|nr:hypothetical protein NLJ89_g6343 [Agrocybe chaxingu]